MPIGFATTKFYFENIFGKNWYKPLKTSTFFKITLDLSVKFDF